LRKAGVLLLLAVMLSAASGSTRVLAGGSHGSALIMSSLDSAEPFGSYGTMIADRLQSMGYTVTTLRDSQVTVSLLMSGLNRYNIIIWRTDSYTWAHRIYWYVGERATQSALTTYASDFANYALDYHAGIIGVNQLFFQEHFFAGSLGNVELAFLLFNLSNAVASEFVKFGVRSVIYCVNEISLQFGLADDLADQVVAYLAMGNTVNDAVYTTISPYLYGNPPEDPLDASYPPPFWYMGDGSLTIG
jgi:hypothetical protein